jgi:hypothetical protein
VAELRAAGVGVDRVLLVHDGSPASSDLFQAVLTMLDPQVLLGLAPLVPPGTESVNGYALIHQDQERAERLNRGLQVLELKQDDGPEVVRQAREGQYDLIIIPLPGESSDPVAELDQRSRYIVAHAHCHVFLAARPTIPQEVVDTTPSG